MFLDNINKPLSGEPLTQSTIIGKLHPDFRTRIWQLAKSIKMEKGQTLFIQEDSGDALYAVESGSIEISVIGVNGKKLSLNIMRPPEVFGEIGALDGGPRTATAAAMEPTTVRQIRKTQMLDVMSSHPEFSAELIQILCERIRWVSQQVEDLALSDLEGRLARWLLVLGQKISDDEDWLPISQSQLADFLGTSRETVNKMLQLWCASGLIVKERSRLTIINQSGLKKLAGIS